MRSRRRLGCRFVCQVLPLRVPVAPQGHGVDAFTQGGEGFTAVAAADIACSLVSQVRDRPETALAGVPRHGWAIRATEVAEGADRAGFAGLGLGAERGVLP